jgi:hypothetical protein
MRDGRVGTDVYASDPQLPTSQTISLRTQIVDLERCAMVVHVTSLISEVAYVQRTLSTV